MRLIVVCGAAFRSSALRRVVGLLVAACVSALAAPTAGAAISPRGILHPAGAAELGSAAGPGFSPTLSKAEPYAVCPRASAGHAECLSVVVPSRAAVESAEVKALFGHGSAPAVVPNYEGSGEGEGFSPQNLREAYKLPSTGGSGQTVAIVDAYDDPSAEADLKIYRKEYGLSECTKANGCFKRVNQEGKEENYPAGAPKEENWGLEISLDVDMVSAVCQECKVLLVEANNNEDPNLYAAEDEAASWEEAGTKRKATEISNSWAGEEYPEEASDDTYFDHPGIPITVGAGDGGYGVSYPASSPDVISVGGTALERSSDARGWSEEVWGGTGSGCSAYEEKPRWETQAGCSHRIDNDVSAVASTETPVSVYDSYEESGWVLLGGTSVATPIVAGVEALSSSAFRSAGPSAFTRVGEGGELFDVTEGEDGFCGTYLCQAEVGYDGPSGWGTPDGPPSLPVAITEAATVVSPSEVTLHGSVDPGGLKTEFHFEYGETTAYGTSVPIPDVSAGSGTEYVEVGQPIEGLTGRTPYHYRITATNTNGTFHGVDRTFGTTPPSATTGAASEIHAGEATLHATVNPEGLETTYYFEYGTSASYGSKMPLRGQALGSGTGDIEVNTAIRGLTGGETYHFRIVATNVAGAVYGEDETFATAPAEWAAQTLSQPAESSVEREAYGISCVQPDACVAVGSYWSLGVHTRATLAETWDGSAWSVMATPNPPGLEEGWRNDRYAVLEGVSCPTTNDCVAVGSYKNTTETVQPLAERWNGSEWSMMGVAAPSGGAPGWLEGVSCVSSMQCTAVGHATNSLGAEETLAERWDGSAWTVQPTPSPAGASGARLTAVSCFSLEECTAVGFLENGSGQEETLAERWDGGGWTIQPTPSSAGVVSWLASVSCASQTVCMAVGASGGKTLAERWEGDLWSLVSTPELPPEPKPSEGNSLRGVSCTSVDSCTAVGSNYGVFERSGDPLRPRPLGERWDGTSWSLLGMVALPEPAEWWHESWLYAVSCAEATACAAAGDNLSAPQGDTSYMIGFAESELGTPTPTVAGVQPGTGSLDGGTTVKITGENLQGANAVHFGTVEATGVTVRSGSEVTAIAPPWSGGDAIAEVTVTTPGGTSPVTIGDSFVYEPTVTQIEPSSGSVGGGTSVTISGGAFAGWFQNGAGETGPFVSAVKFGAKNAESFKVESEEPTAEPLHALDAIRAAANVKIVAVAPPGTGAADVTVETLGGTSPTVPADQFTYVPPPPVAEFSVSTSSPTAGQPVSFDGSASSDPNGAIASYSWDFGDGSAAGTGVSPSHTYAHAGSYEVTLTVTDSSGRMARVSHTVNVARASLVSGSGSGGSEGMGAAVGGGIGGSVGPGPMGPGQGEMVSVAMVKVKVSSSSVTITLDVSQAGVAAISGAGLKTTSKSVTAGTTQIKVALTKAGQRDRRHHKKVKVAVELKAMGKTVSGSKLVRL
jgi:PKD repeat protein